MLTENEYYKLQKEKREKKDLALIQTLSQSGGVPIELLNSMREPLSKYKYSDTQINNIKKIMGTLVKNKK